MATNMIKQWGMPDACVRRRLNWSFRGLLLTGMEPSCISLAIRRKQRALSSVLEMLNYDPSRRGTAATIVAMAQSMDIGS